MRTMNMPRLLQSVRAAAHASRSGAYARRTGSGRAARCTANARASGRDGQCAARPTRTTASSNRLIVLVDHLVADATAGRRRAECDDERAEAHGRLTSDTRALRHRLLPKENG